MSLHISSILSEKSKLPSNEFSPNIFASSSETTVEIVPKDLPNNCISLGVTERVILSGTEKTLVNQWRIHVTKTEKGDRYQFFCKGLFLSWRKPNIVIGIFDGFDESTYWICEYHSGHYIFNEHGAAIEVNAEKKVVLAEKDFGNTRQAFLFS